jgi:hypothetical protein
MKKYVCPNNNNIYPNKRPTNIPEYKPNNDIYPNDNRIEYLNNNRIFGQHSGNEFGIDSGSKHSFGQYSDNPFGPHSGNKNTFGQHSGKVFGQYSGNNINPISSAYLYFIEGHIPIEAVNKLLTEKPEINGIALPEIPSGSPGMPGFKIEKWKIHSIKNGQDQGIFMEI